MDIEDMAIHRVVFQKSDFHGNSDIQNSQKLDPIYSPLNRCTVMSPAFRVEAIVFLSFILFFILFLST
jgi:hypothetical protein